jgi:hypothetical protein
MLDWLIDKWHALSWESIIISTVLFIIGLAISFGSIGLVIVKIPANYFSSHYEHDFLPNSPWHVRWGAVILKNLLGAFLIILGLILTVLPGQGILTILLGLVMLDIPGKRPIEAKIIKRPAIRDAANKLRAKYGKPPLELD